MELKDYKKTDRPVKILQFGEGNFLRGFADYMIDRMNERGFYNGNIAVFKPTLRGSLQKLRDQNCNYTVYLRGISDGEIKTERRVVTSIASAAECHTDPAAFMAYACLETLEVIISNTTEAGIYFDASEKADNVPQAAFTARLTAFLYERFNAGLPGLIVIPMELIEDNGGKVKKCILDYIALWKLPEAFTRWINDECIFCCTLVDRILTGYPDDAEELFREFGYRDAYLDAGECFGLWVIESDRLDEVRRALPLDKAGEPVIFTENLQPYRDRKVRVLNGTHTGSVEGAYLMGLRTVGECMEDADVSEYMNKLVYEEIVPNVPIAYEEAMSFAVEVFDRFRNPFNKHYILSITLNAIPKWKTRLIPTLHDYLKKNGKLPMRIMFSLAALLEFYHGKELDGGTLTGYVGEESYGIRDDISTLSFFASRYGDTAEEYVGAALRNAELWGEDLTAIPGLEEEVCRILRNIRTLGAREAVKKL